MKKILLALLLLLPGIIQAQTSRSATDIFAQSNVSVPFRETDQVLPNGLYRIHVNGDVFTIEKNTANNGSFSTNTVIFSSASGTAVGGTGVSGRCAYWTGTNTISSDAGCLYNASTDALTIVGSTSLAAGAFTVSTVAATLNVPLAINNSSNAALSFTITKSSAAVVFNQIDPSFEYDFNSDGTTQLSILGGGVGPSIRGLGGLNLNTNDGSKVQTADQFQALGYLTTANCSTTACSSATAGSTIIAAGATTATIATTSVTANSEIHVTEDSSLGARLGVTCNTQASTLLGAPTVTTRTAATSFVVGLDVAPTSTPRCFSWGITN